MSDLTKLQTWFQDYLLVDQVPTKSGGYHEDVSHDGSDEDKPKGIFIKGHADESVSEAICSNLDLTGHDLQRYSTAFAKLNKLMQPFTYRNATAVRLSAPFQKAIDVLLELEGHAFKVARFDPAYGDTVPTTNLIEYKG